MFQLNRIHISALFIVLLTASCTFARGEIVISKLPEANVQFSKAESLDLARYRSIIVILPDVYNETNRVTGGAVADSVEAAKEKRVEESKGKTSAKTESVIPHPTMTLSRSQDYDFVINEAERYLLQCGFNIISRDIIAKIDELESTRYGTKSYMTPQSPTEKALLLGQKTNADAMLVISHLGAWPSENYFVFDNKKWSFQNRPKPQDAEGIWVSYPLWEVSMEAKLIDIKTGQVVWMGSGRHHSRSLFPTDWQGVLKIRGDEVTMEYENFRIEDYNTYGYLYQQVAVLEKSVLATLK
jgi:hypothetical protein